MLKAGVRCGLEKKKYIYIYIYISNRQMCAFDHDLAIN